MKSSLIFQNFVLLVSLLASSIHAFAPSSSSLSTSTRFTTSICATEGSKPDPKEVIGTTITVSGDVNGGYVRTCIVNEVRKVLLMLQGVCIMCTCSFLKSLFSHKLLIKFYWIFSYIVIHDNTRLHSLED